jgi:hypothetical protein
MLLHVLTLAVWVRVMEANYSAFLHFRFCRQKIPRDTGRTVASVNENEICQLGDVG